MRSANRETGFLDRTLRRSDGLHRYVVYVPREWTRRKQWPVVLFLHGAGERGADGLRQTEVGLGPAIRGHSDRFPCLVVFPQCPLASWWTFPDAEALALDALDRTVTHFRGDRARVYLTGISMGGYGVWDLAGNNPGVFAALAPVCGGIVPPRWVEESENPRLKDGKTLFAVETAELPKDDRLPARAAFDCEHSRTDSDLGEAPCPPIYREAALRLGGTPAWVFHGALDPKIPVSESRRMVEVLRYSGSEVKYTEYPDTGHESWEQAYAEPNLIPWLLARKLRAKR